jgi:hypothetical protein
MANYLTQDDIANYGTDLIDVTQRAALHAVAPHLQNLEQQNAELQRRLAQEARRNLDQRVERAVPNFREVDRDPNWHQWLLGVDALSGCMRQQLLNGAVASGSESRIAAFFRKFQQEAGTSGSQTSPTRGRSQAHTGKPVYSREQIGRLYEQHRKGVLVGPTWDRL